MAAASIYGETFNQLKNAVDPDVDPLGSDGAHLAKTVEEFRWSITYGGDEGMDHQFYKGVLPAVLKALVKGGADLKSWNIRLTVNNWDNNDEMTFWCSINDLQLYGDTEDELWVNVYYPETDSISREPYKVYLHQITNVHFG